MIASRSEDEEDGTRHSDSFFASPLAGNDLCASGGTRKSSQTALSGTSAVLPPEELVHGCSMMDPCNPFTWELNFGCSEEQAQVRKLMLVCIHGNETCGLEAVNLLLKEGWFLAHSAHLSQKKERLKILLGNPKAVCQNTRFVDLNLNRIFQEPFINAGKTNSLDLFGKAPYELTRLPVLAKAITWCDYFIDIHSTSAVTPPFAISLEDSASKAFASSFPVEYVIENLSKIVRGTSLEWAKLHSKVAACVECGHHADSQAVGVATQVIKCFVLNGIETQAHHILSCTKAQLICRGFRFMKKVRAFQIVQYEEVLAEDDNGLIRCPFPGGAILIMPTENPIFGEEAWFWGEPK